MAVHVIIILLSFLSIAIDNYHYDCCYNIYIWVLLLSLFFSYQCHCSRHHDDSYDHHKYSCCIRLFFVHIVASIIIFYPTTMQLLVLSNMSYLKLRHLKEWKRFQHVFHSASGTCTGRHPSHDLTPQQNLYQWIVLWVNVLSCKSYWC